MTPLLEAVLSNILIAAVLAVPAALASGWGRRPALTHGLWLLVLLKLVTPPLIHVPIPWPADDPPATGPQEPLAAVEQGEEALRGLGFRQFRVRHHGAVARIEIAREELPRALNLEMFAEFSRIFKALGFAFVTVDTEGFRSGSMNTVPAAQPLIKLLS